MIKYIAMVVVIFLVVMSAGCASPPETVIEYRTELSHPITLPAPSNPGVAIKVITKDRINNGELPDKAYVGFEYNEWLEFAKWMHEYRTHNKSLKQAVEAYRTQDTRNVETRRDELLTTE